LFTIVGTLHNQTIDKFYACSIHHHITITMLLPLPLTYYNHNASSLAIDLLQSCLMLHNSLNFHLMFWFFTYMLVTWFSFVTLKVMEDNELHMWGMWGWGWGNRTCKWVLAPIWQDYQRWHCYRRQSFLEGFTWDYKSNQRFWFPFHCLAII